MAQEQKPQNQQESQEQLDPRQQREQRKRQLLERLSRPRKSEQEILAERAELPKSERFKRRKERLQKVRAITETDRVRVNPRNEAIRKAYQNIPGRMAFRDSGSIEWPLDQFTKRRLRDGDVTIEQQEPQQRAETTQAQQEPRAARNQAPTPPTS